MPSPDAERSDDLDATDVPDDGLRPTWAPSRSTWGSQLVRWLPWAVTLGALAFIAFTTDVAMVSAALQRANLPVFVGACLSCYLAVWAFDSVALWRLFRWFHGPMTLREALPIRGASYLVGIVNYNAASAVIAAYVGKTRGVPLLESLGSLLWMAVLDLVTLAAIIMIGADVLGELAVSARLSAGVVLLAFAGALVYWRLGFDFFVLGTLRERRIFHAFRLARGRHYLAMIGLRLPIFGLYVLIHEATLWAFGIRIPLWALLVYVPVQMLVAAVPISVGGIGTVQVAQRVLYGPYGPAPAPLATVDAFGVALVFGFMAPRALIGLACMRRVTNELGGRGGERPTQT